jgi:outer membrane protein TolC
VELLSILDSTEVLLDALLRFNQSLYNNHKVTEDAVFRAEFELADLQSQRAAAIEQREISASYFNFLLNRDLQTPIEVDRSIHPDEELLDLNELAKTASSNRTELKQTEAAITANNYLLSVNKGGKLPDLSAGALLGFQGFGYTFDEDQDYALFQFNLNVPLFSGFINNAQIQETKYELDRLNNQYDELKKQINLQVIQAYRSYQSAEANYRAKKLARTSAEKSLDIIRKKYVQSQVILVDLLDARNKFTSSELQTAIAKYDLLIRRAELERTIAL